MVPNGWNQLKGKEITSKITKGSSPKWQGFDYQKEGTLFVTSENVRDGFLDISSPKYLPLEFNQKLKNSQLEKGDILINIVGASIGRSCQFDIENQSANINQAVCLFRTNELVKSAFIFQFLQHSSTVNKLLGTQSESARPNLSLSDMRDFVFSIPPLPEQRKIAKILSTWDKAISTTERLIDNSKQQKKALMQQLLTGKKRLLDDSGKPFEGEWKEGRVRDLVRSLDAGISVNSEDDNNLNASYKILKTSCVSSGKFQLSETKSVIDEDEISRLKEPVVSDSIILSRMNTPALVGANGYIEYEIPNTFLPDRLWQVKPNNNCVHMKWLGHWFASTHTRYTLSSAATGTSGSMKNITKPDVLNIKVAIPSLSEQYKIATVLTNADKEIELLEQQHADLKQEKKALMQQLLTGKRRVKVEQTDLKAN